MLLLYILCGINAKIEQRYAMTIQGRVCKRAKFSLLSLSIEGESGLLFLMHWIRSSLCPGVWTLFCTKPLPRHVHRLHDNATLTTHTSRRTSLGTLRSNDATTTRTSLKKVYLRSVSIYRDYSYPITLSNVREPS